MKNRVFVAMCLAAAMMAAGCAQKEPAAEQAAAPAEAAAQEEGKAEEAAPAAEENAEAAGENGAADAAGEADKAGSEAGQAADKDGQAAGEAAGQAGEAAASEGTKYESPDGWYVHYDDKLVKQEEDEDGVSFTYTGESAGINALKFTYHMNRMPDEVLYDAIATDEGMPEHTRSESNFAGRDDVWCMRVSVTPKEGSDQSEEYIAVEHNGGTLLIRIDSCQQADEETGIKVSDTISYILDSFTFTDHDPQTYSAHVPGKYVQAAKDTVEGQEVSAEYYVELKADHTGVVSLQDTVPVIWYSREGILLNAETGEQIYEYVVEGDALYLIDRTGDGQTLEFAREQ